MKNPLGRDNKPIHHFDDTFLSFEERTAPLVEIYVNGHLCVHIHFIVVKSVRGLQAGKYCAFVKAPANALHTPLQHSELIHSDLDFLHDKYLAIGSQLPTKERFAVLIDNSHLVDDLENRGLVRFPYVVRLQLLDDVPCLLAKTPDFVKTPTPCELPVLLDFGELAWVGKNRKFSERVRRSLFPNRQFIDGVIESGSQAVKDFSDDEFPVVRDRRVGVVDENNLAGFQIVLLPDCVRLTVSETSKLYFESLQLLSCSSDFSPWISE